MRLVCGPDDFELPGADTALRTYLYGSARLGAHAGAGEAILAQIRRHRLEPSSRAWDLLTIALSVVTADFAAVRERSPDGWTREIELDIAVSSPEFWRSQADSLARALAFLTTDRWMLRFHGGGVQPAPPRYPIRPLDDSVMLLSGGLDSLVGAIDLVAAGRKPFAVSQTVRGDGEKQIAFASSVGGGLNHIQLNHNASTPGEQEPSQRARSFIFIAYAVLVATALQRYREGGYVSLYVCENGFIAVNPPLTGGRLGSLSTRTAHPDFLGRLQHVFDAAGLRVRIENPYGTRTKGEMLLQCADQEFLVAHAVRSTSCGRFQRFNYRHCGRCVPCQVRRAAFLTWGAIPDSTDYVYEQLGRRDFEHAGFDDVRSVAIALVAQLQDGIESWLGHSLSSPRISNRSDLAQMLERGLTELRALHNRYRVT